MIQWHKEDTIGILTLDSPPRNSLEVPDFAAMTDLRTWTSDDSLKGLIITGKGKHFSAGADLEMLKARSSDPEALAASLLRGKELLDFIENLDVPTIAAIRGACFGGGLEIALACHIRVCTSNSIFSFPEVNLNIMPGLGGTLRLPSHVSKADSLEMILSGDTVNADKALEMGLVSHVVKPGDLMEYAHNLMRRMTKDRPLRVIHAVVRSMRNASRLSQTEAMNEETRIFCQLAVAEFNKGIPEE